MDFHLGVANRKWAKGEFAAILIATLFEFVAGLYTFDPHGLGQIEIDQHLQRWMRRPKLLF